MKVLDIAFKDIQRAFHSAFGVIMMFVVPILLPGIIYAAFGGALSGSADRGGFDIAVTRVVVANLDESTESHNGETVAQILRGSNFARLLAVTEADSEIAARERVNNKQADVAVIIPAGFGEPGGANVIVYYDPTLTIGPLITKQIISGIVDGFNGGQIAVQVALEQAQANGVQLTQEGKDQVSQQYGTWAQAQGRQQQSGLHPMLTVQAPPAKSALPNSASMIASMMAGMLVFFAFYTAAIMAESIIREEEEGTLPRLFTTPTARTTILGGKFVAIFLMVIVQVTVVMIISSLLFKITWGDPLLVALSIVGLVICAAGFGLFLLSFIRTTRQAGPILGGVLTVTSMLGGLYSMTIPNAPAFMDTLSLSMPQGWVMRSWKLTLNGAMLGDVLLPVLVAAIVGVVLFGIGTLNFRRRYA